MPVKYNEAASNKLKAANSPQPLSVDRGVGLTIAIQIIAAMGQAELTKLLNGVVTKVGKENAAPVLLGFKGALDAVIKKNKIK